MALDSPGLIDMLMRAQTTDCQSRLVFMAVKWLFDKFETQDIESLTDMN